MERDSLNIISKKIESVFSEKFLNNLGREEGFLKRERIVTPKRMLLSIISVMSLSGVKNLSELQRGFNAVNGTNVQYKPFHNQLKKAGFANFMREVSGYFFSCFSQKVLKAKTQHNLSRFKGIKIHDGSSFALKDGLREHFPGRFNKIKPAAVELHVTLDLFEGQVDKAVLTPDTTSERNEVPEAEELSGYLSMFDRGYFTLDYIKQLIDNDAFLIIRGKSDCNPKVVSAKDENGRRIKSFEGKKLRQGPKLSKSGITDLEVVWRKSKTNISCRMLATWNPKTKSYIYLVTNLDSSFTPEEIFHLYNLRWQIELLFKEWKSSANLHSFRTNNPNIAEALIWSAIASATFKRFLAYSTQMLYKIEISTQIVASSAKLILPSLIKAIKENSLYLIKVAINDILLFFKNNASRTNIKKDYDSGRMKCMLEPCF